MRRPYQEEAEEEDAKKAIARNCNGIEARQVSQQPVDQDTLPIRSPMGYAYSMDTTEQYSGLYEPSCQSHFLQHRPDEYATPYDRHPASPALLRRRALYPQEILDAMESVNFIAEHLKREAHDSSVWQQPRDIIYFKKKKDSTQQQLDHMALTYSTIAFLNAFTIKIIFLCF